MMQLSLLMHTQLSATPSPLLLFPSSVRRRGRRRALHAGCSTPFLPSTVGFKTQQRCCHSLHPHYNGVLVKATLLESPVMWVGRLCIFYALLKTGIAGSPSSPLLYDSGDGGSSGDMGFSKWLEEAFKGNSEEKEAADRRKLVSKWHVTTKGTLKRSYRVPSRSQGQKLLKGIASLLSEDDHFLDAASHKGCRIRRESAHGESVCCNNVRALFDEIPTPHLVVEITAFPSGRLTEGDYTKAEKLERVLRSGSSI